MDGRPNQSTGARYEHQPNAAVRPPQGVALALPKLVGDAKPEELLYKAKQAKKDQPRWKVNARIDGSETRITGYIDGDRSDLTIAIKGSGSIHEIIVGEVRYVSRDKDKTWEEEEVNRDYYHLVRAPVRFREDERIPPFDIVEQKVREDGGVDLHIRFRSPEAVNAEDDRNNCWLEIGPDKSLRLKQYAGPLVLEGEYVYGSVEYEPLEKDEGVVKAPK